MLEQLKYKNHVNEVFEFGKDGIYVDTNDLRDYEWKTTKNGNRISALTRQISTRKLPVVIICDSEANGILARNRLLEVVEKDVLTLQHGQIIIGDYYFKCFVTKSQKKNYLASKRYMTMTLTLTSDYPYWVKESVTQYRNGSGSGEGQGIGLDFSYEHPYDYYSALSSNILLNSGFVPSNFKMKIYGSCSNPSISICGHTYQVNCNVGANEYLIVDSTTKKVQLIQNDGTIVNKFNDRNKQSYLFQKIPAGNNTVTWSGNFGFDVVIMEERSEPKWI